jgi:methylmalonyl-CoA/ethylmalonyl-CoA epimerase
MTAPVLDHFAIGLGKLTAGWELFGGVLGGTWAYGGQSDGFWWGQLEFSAGPKIELLTPTGGPDSGFLERFLAARGPGPHHFNFIVPDLEAALSQLKAIDVEPVRVSMENPRWKEAFLHPKDAFGVVIQLAEQSELPPAHPPPAGLPEPGPPSAFALIEHEVDDLAAATTLFADGLGGAVVTETESAAELTWQPGARLRLLATGAAGMPRSGGRPGCLSFRRDEGGFSADEHSRAGDLAKQLGVILRLDT